jgi:hypothetical protein
MNDPEIQRLKNDIVSLETRLNSKLNDSRSQNIDQIKSIVEPLIDQKIAQSTSGQEFQSQNGQVENGPNIILQVCYNGEPRQLAVYGQLLRTEEEFDPIPPII